MTTIKRRILRRLQMCKMTTLNKYAELLETTNDEVNILQQDLLINVTGFFRDATAHQYLRTKLFPKLLKKKTAGETLRLWVPACSTGEEAYSIAMYAPRTADKQNKHDPNPDFCHRPQFESHCQSTPGRIFKT